MLEYSINLLSGINPVYIYILVFIIAYIENIFPPFPSDVLVAIAASFSVKSEINLIVLLFLSSIGSTAGFITMYFIGKLFGKKILESGKIKFIKPEAVRNFEEKVAKYGIILVVVNRFLAGTRAVVSFVIGMSDKRLKLVIILSFISSAIWNTILIFIGYSVGNNVEKIDLYLSTYNKIVIVILIVLAIIYFIFRLIKKNAKKA